MVPVVDNQYSRERFCWVRDRERYELFERDLRQVVKDTCLYRSVAKQSLKSFHEVSYSLGTKVWPINGILRYHLEVLQNLRKQFVISWMIFTSHVPCIAEKHFDWLRSNGLFNQSLMKCHLHLEADSGQVWLHQRGHLRSQHCQRDVCLHSLRHSTLWHRLCWLAGHG